MSQENPTFASLGKQEALRRLYGKSPYKPFRRAATHASRLYLEWIDFNLVYFPLKHLGYKAVAGVTGELVARLSTPENLSVVLGVSAKLDYPQIEELWEGISGAAQEYGYENVALDIIPSQNGLCISVSAEGKASKKMSSRPRPKTKDLICVSGSLGAAYLGMRLMEKEREGFEKGEKVSDSLERYKMIVGSYLKPESFAGTVRRFEESGIVPSAGYFVTRGLADAVLSLSRDTSLGVKIYADRIPFEGNTFTLGKELDIDPVSAAMNGGDDMRLLFTVPILDMEKFRRDFQTFDIIGHLALEEAGCVLVTPDGVEFPVTAQGWEDR